MGKLLIDATERKYALGLFVVPSLAMIKPVIEAAMEEKSPVIIGAGYKHLNSLVGINVFASAVKAQAESAEVPAAIHLDHGKNLQEVLQCIRGGFNSIMYDASDHPLEKNIQLTRKVAEIVHEAGIPIEAEINKIPVVEEAIPTDVSEEFLTKPEEARRFVEETKVDTLAISVGQFHHYPKLVGETHPVPKVAKLDLERIKAIKEATGATLCLHAGSHTLDDQIREAIKLGVTKINVGHLQMVAFTDTVRRTIKNAPDLYRPNEILEPAQLEVKKVVKYEMRVFGSSNKAN